MPVQKTQYLGLLTNMSLIIAGIDEVGRGAFAGPVVAGCVVFDNKKRQEGANLVRIDDSKKLTPKQREMSGIWIKENSLSWGIGWASAHYIDKLGLTKASNKAFRMAIKRAKEKLALPIDRLIIDAFSLPFTAGIPKNKQFAIIGADGKSASVAAASIIAKVYRDDYMSALAKKPRYKWFKWDENKGYGTKAHQEAIIKYGTSKYHRQLFLKS